MAFSIAGSMAFKDAMRKADPIITEPIMKVAVIVPDEYLGDVIGDLNARRGQIQGMEAMAGTQRVNAFVPLAQMFGYATDLRSKTQGRGQYVMEPSHYEPVPNNIADQILSLIHIYDGGIHDLAVDEAAEHLIGILHFFLVQQAKLVLYSIFKPRWAELITAEVKYRCV